MGRITKKKSTKKKKKTQPKVSAAPVQSPEGDGSTQPVEAAVAVASEKKKPAAVKRAPAPAKSQAAKASKGKKGYLEISIQFLREVRVELKKVTWPSRKQTMGSTVVVIVLVMIISLFLGVVDIGLSSLIRVVLQ